jgi:hypothetical protein
VGIAGALSVDVELEVASEIVDVGRGVIGELAEERIDSLRLMDPSDLFDTTLRDCGGGGAGAFFDGVARVTEDCWSLLIICFTASAISAFAAPWAELSATESSSSNCRSSAVVDARV